MGVYYFVRTLGVSVLPFLEREMLGHLSVILLFPKRGQLRPNFWLAFVVVLRGYGLPATRATR